MVQATDPTRSTGSATPDRPTGRNQLAFVSLLLAFVFPLRVLVQMLPLLLAPQSKSLPDSVPLWILNNLLNVITVPALIATLVTGHIALSQAKRYSPAQARRWMAITGLVLGYLSILTALAFYAVVVITLR